MKATILFPTLFLSLSLFLPSTQAQIGITAGIGFSDIAFVEYGQSPYLGYEINSLEHRLPKVAFQAGLFASFPFKKRFAFQPELLFSAQGLDYSTDYLYDKLIYKINTTYLQMPLLVKYTISLKRKWQPALYAGPYGAIKLSARKILEAEGWRQETSMPTVRNTDLGLVAGFSAGFELGGGQLTVDFRTSYSLANVMDRIEAYTPEYAKAEKEYARNVNVLLILGYRFSL